MLCPWDRETVVYEGLNCSMPLKQPFHRPQKDTIGTTLMEKVARESEMRKRRRLEWSYEERWEKSVRAHEYVESQTDVQRMMIAHNKKRRAAEERAMELVKRRIELLDIPMPVRPPKVLGKGNNEQHPTFWRDWLANFEPLAEVELTTKSLPFKESVAHALSPIDRNQRRLAILHRKPWTGHCEHCGHKGHEELWCLKRRAECVEYAKENEEELYEGDIMLNPEELPHGQRGFQKRAWQEAKGYVAYYDSDSA